MEVDLFVRGLAVFLLLMATSIVAAMLSGRSKIGSSAIKDAYRETGVDILFVIVPFVILVVANLLNGTFFHLLLSTELPMASLILVAFASMTILKAALGQKNKFENSRLLLLASVCLIFLLCFSGLLFYIVFKEPSSAWFMVINALVFSFSLTIAFAIGGPMTAFSKHAILFEGELAIADVDVDTSKLTG